MNLSFESPFAGHMQEMLQFKKSLGYSDNSYAGYLLNFDRFCMENYPDASVLSKEIVMEWGRKNQNQKPASVKRKIIALREFARYLNSVGEKAYVAPLEMFGRRKPFVPYVYTDKELTAFFHASDRFPEDKRSPYRHLVVPAMFRLLYCCGLRPIEARHLLCSDFDLDAGILHIKETKRHKDRTVPVALGMLELCRKYHSLTSLAYTDREYFFQNPNGGVYPEGWVQRQFWKCWKIAGITSFHGSTPRVYDFRHNYATRILQKWLEEGKDLQTYLPYLSAYMGHYDFSETAYYIHLLPDRLVRTTSINWDELNSVIPEVE